MFKITCFSHFTNHNMANNEKKSWVYIEIETSAIDSKVGLYFCHIKPMLRNLGSVSGEMATTAY